MKIDKQVFSVGGIMLMAILFRLINNKYMVLPNFSPIAAIGLLGAALFRNKLLALAIPFSILLLSDILIGATSNMKFGLHPQSVYVYLSFFIITIIGIFSLSNGYKIGKLIGLSLLSSVVFFVISNFGVWINGGYPQIVAGLVECYVAAIPFFSYTILGDLFFVGLTFGAYELIKMFYLSKVQA